jgi:hypothetical protein
MLKEMRNNEGGRDKVSEFLQNYNNITKVICIKFEGMIGHEVEPVCWL